MISNLRFFRLTYTLQSYDTFRATCQYVHISMRKIVKNPTGYKVLINCDMESLREPLNNVCKIFGR